MGRGVRNRGSGPPSQGERTAHPQNEGVRQRSDSPAASRLGAARPPRPHPERVSAQRSAPAGRTSHIVHSGRYPWRGQNTEDSGFGGL
ncbi:hypothetical protein GCM10010428_06880 [Actinosynnema pretiosum subsp. pretiosum]